MFNLGNGWRAYGRDNVIVRQRNADCGWHKTRIFHDNTDMPVDVFLFQFTRGKVKSYTLTTWVTVRMGDRVQSTHATIHPSYKALAASLEQLAENVAWHAYDAALYITTIERLADTEKYFNEDGDLKEDSDG